MITAKISVSVSKLYYFTNKLRNYQSIGLKVAMLPIVNFQLSRPSTLIDFGSVSTVLKESNLFELLEGQLAKLVVCFPKDEDINELYSSCITRIIYKYLVESQLEAALNLLPKVAEQHLNWISNDGISKNLVNSSKNIFRYYNFDETEDIHQNLEWLSSHWPKNENLKQALLSVDFIEK